MVSDASSANGSSVRPNFHLGRSAGVVAAFSGLPLRPHRSLIEANHAYKGASLTPPAREGAGIVTMLGGVLLCAGGTNGVEPVGTCFLCDPRSGIWYPVAPMRHRRAFHAMVTTTGGQVLALGGMSPSVTNTVEKYDPTMDRWVDLEPLRHPVAYAQAAMSGNMVTITGRTPQVYIL
jgi:hypothetical protein